MANAATQREDDDEESNDEGMGDVDLTEDVAVDEESGDEEEEKKD